MTKIFELNGYMLGILLHVSEFFLIIRVYNPPERETAYDVNLPTKIDNELKTLLTKLKNKTGKSFSMEILTSPMKQQVLAKTIQATNI
jgi:hypothetical protein